MSAAKRWCFTLNNPTNQEEQSIKDAHTNCSYLVVGRERGESGTPHLQGFLILLTKLRLRSLKRLRGFERCHLELSRGTPQQASEYCKKDGDYDEYGELPSTQGKRTEFGDLKEWIKAQETFPSFRDVAENFPSLAGRYPKSCERFIAEFGNRPNLMGDDPTDVELRDWQRELQSTIDEEPSTREVIFVVDPEGNKGKSWMTRYWYSTRDDLQRLSVGKRDDLAFAIDPTKKLFVFDIPRQCMELLQYPILEQLKDRMVFSSKYESTCKVLVHPCHVVVFSNEEPDYTKMTSDRYNVINI
jgi:hypothetical protein